ncbi:MAG TPA: nicotinic acid mononucleotide adenylyltransferase [Planctomycetaceae bacterium]|nr:nicotinic acid mononucleotide adenylyltransferase [Planctomycetaceae bacterium]
MRLGVFGGAFDPVHTGHLVLASECRQQLALDAVWLVPSGSPPHKDPGGLADAGTRVEMLELATAGDPGLVVNRIEIDREGVSYTVDTLETIAASDPGCELFLLLGADSVADLANWYQPERICELARIVAVNRGGTTSKTAVTGCRVEEVTMPAIDVSSRDIRHRIHQGRSIRHLVPRAVEAYLDEHALYNDDSE